MMKTCTKCHVEYPATLEFFYKSRLGLRPVCKVCYSANTTAWYHANKDVRATWCALNRDKRLAKMKAYDSANFDTLSAKKKARRELDPEPARALCRQRYKDNPSYYKAASSAREFRVRAAGSLTASEIKAQRARQNERCYWCRKSVGDKGHMDHVIPLSKGGSNSADNIVLACACCNLSKRAKMPCDFAGRLF